MKYPTFSIFQFINETILGEKDGNNQFDLTIRKTIFVNVNQQNYNKIFYRLMRPLENISEDIIYGKIGTQKTINENYFASNTFYW